MKQRRRESLVAEPAACGERLDLFLVRRLAEVSRKAVKRALDGGRVFVDERCERRAGLQLAGGETVVLTLDLPAPLPAAPAFPLLYRDAELAALDKPAGLPAHPTGASRPNALEGLTELLRTEGKDVAPILLHRLDADTSGVLLFAFTARANRGLACQFADREMKKSYLALVAGDPPDTFVVANHLRPGVRGRTVAVASGGQTAETDFRTLGRGPGFALVEASPRTGRTHQIRAHLSGEGFALLGDTLYSGPATFSLDGEKVAVGRHLLHARCLTFRHPATGAPCAIEAPLPTDFLPFLERLDRPCLSR